MAELSGADISEWQGVVDWDTLNANANFVFIRSSFGTARKDLQFDRNQAEARRVRAAAGPLGIGYYYYAYPVQIDAVTSADFFVKNLGGLQDTEVLVLDLEGDVGPDPVGWSLAFLKRVEMTTTVKPLIYLNQSLLHGYDWSPVIANDNGLWLAVYDSNKETTPAPEPWPFVAVKQWTNVDHVPGIPNQVDGDTFFGGFDAWNAYGYKSQAVPVPTPPAPPQLPPPPVVVPTPPTVTPIETPAPPTAPSGEPAPGSSPGVTPPTSVEPPATVNPDPSSVPFWSTTVGRLLIGAAITVLTPIVMSLQNFQTNDLGLATFILGTVTVLTGVKDFLNSEIRNTPNSRH